MAELRDLGPDLHAARPAADVRRVSPLQTHGLGLLQQVEEDAND